MGFKGFLTPLQAWRGENQYVVTAGSKQGQKKKEQKCSPGEKNVRGLDVPSTQIEFDH
jgi:hypothetical protein